MTDNLQQPLISIIMPCFCCANYLDQSVYTTLEQKIIDKDGIKKPVYNTNLVELIMINDASSDDNNTHNKIIELSNKYQNIKYINLPKNIGQANARNVGISNAGGKYIGFIDADDKVNTKMFIEIQKALDNYKEPDIVVWGITELYYETSKKLSNTVYVIPKETYSNNKKGLIDIAINLEEQTLFGYGVNKIYRNSIIQEKNIRIPDEHLIEDTMFNVYAFQESKSIACINKSLYYYIKRSKDKNTVTSNYLPDYFEQYCQKIINLKEWYFSNGVYNERTKTMLANYYVRYSLSAIWRNTTKDSKMTKAQQKLWIDKYFDLDLSKELIEYANPSGKIAKIFAYLFKHKNKKMIYNSAKLIDFVTKNMITTLSKVRQSR